MNRTSLTQKKADRYDSNKHISMLVNVGRNSDNSKIHTPPYYINYDASGRLKNSKKEG